MIILIIIVRVLVLVLESSLYHQDDKSIIVREMRLISLLNLDHALSLCIDLKSSQKHHL